MKNLIVYTVVTHYPKLRNFPQFHTIKFKIEEKKNFVSSSMKV